MLVLGIECTAHTFSVGIVDARKQDVLFHEKSQFVDEVSGMDLRRLSDFHVSHFPEVLRKAASFLSEELSLTFSDLDLIAYSQGPGLGNSLKVGALVAKTLAYSHNIPLVGVNHIKAHLDIGSFFTGFQDPLYLFVSGVNTQIITTDEQGKFKIYGETEDIGLGNLLDSFAREAGLGFPGGPAIEQHARQGNQFLELPYTVKGMNVTLAGLYTKLKHLLDQGVPLEDLCFSLQETGYAMMMEIVERALVYTGKHSFVIVGGVAASQRLSEMARSMCEHRGITYGTFPMAYALDNGVMIAWEGYVQRHRASRKIEGLQPKPYITVEDQL